MNTSSTRLVTKWFGGFAVLVLLVALNSRAQEWKLVTTRVIDGFYVGLTGSNGTSASTTNNIAVNDNLIYGIWRTSTNNHAIVYMPQAVEYAYRAELFDTNGVAAPKTKLGKRVGSNFLQLNATFSNRAARLRRTTAMDMPGFGGKSLFRPTDLFEIKKPGRYTLQVSFQIVVRTGVGRDLTAHVVRYPPIEFPLNNN